MKRRHLFLMLLILILAIGLGNGTAEVHTAEADHAVALMKSTFSCGCEREGTGVMISRYALISARHNFYCPVHGTKATKTEYYFGYKPGNEYYHLEVSSCSQTGEASKFNSKDDLGFTVFDEPVGDITGWYEYAVYSKNDLKGKTGTLLNYDWVHRMLTDSFTIQTTSDKRVKWNDLITGGHWEGGPLFTEENKVAGVYVGNNRKASYFCLLDNEVIQQLEAQNAFDTTGGTLPERNGQEDPETQEEAEGLNSASLEKPDKPQEETEEVVLGADDAAWTCPKCGQEGNTGNFCTNCAEPRPTPADVSWTCPKCGQEGNTGNFCSNCAEPRPKPADVSWTCPGCGQEGNTGNFCSNCAEPRP